LIKASALALLASMAYFQSKAQTTLPPEKQWFLDAKYGTFIHWCIEREKSQEEAKQSPESYKASAFEGAKAFTATHYDPKTWAKMMKDWGAQYVVLTTKHHVGFALFDSPRSRFTAKKSSPARRDVLTAYCEAMRVCTTVCPTVAIPIILNWCLKRTKKPLIQAVRILKPGKDSPMICCSK